MGKWDRPWQNMILHHLTPPKKSSEASSFQYQHISTTNEYFRALFCVTQIATVWHGNGVEKTCWNSWTLKMIYRSGSMHQALNTSKGRHLRTRGYPKKTAMGENDISLTIRDKAIYSAFISMASEQPLTFPQTPFDHNGTVTLLPMGLLWPGTPATGSMVIHAAEMTGSSLFFG